jgi:hypothetical protein
MMEVSKLEREAPVMWPFLFPDKINSPTVPASVSPGVPL